MALGVSAVLANEDGLKREWNFEQDAVGSIPKGWKVAETGGVGKLATWQVVADPTAEDSQAVAITTNANYGGTFNLLIAEQTSYKDLEIEVEHTGNKIEVEFDGKKVIEFEDSTFTEPGMVGLWVKADGRSAFDNFEVSAEDEDDDHDEADDVDRDEGKDNDDD